jgi:hypothetical protein
MLDEECRAKRRHRVPAPFRAGCQKRGTAVGSTTVPIVASTGMRLSEAFDIDGELKERGCRYVVSAILLRLALSPLARSLHCFDNPTLGGAKWDFGNDCSDQPTLMMF